MNKSNMIQWYPIYSNTTQGFLCGGFNVGAKQLSQRESIAYINGFSSTSVHFFASDNPHVDLQEMRAALTSLKQEGLCHWELLYYQSIAIIIIIMIVLIIAIV